MASQKRRIKHAAIVGAFAERLKEVRSSRGMTQRQLATQAHVTLSYISKLEAGGASPGLDTIERLANALGIQIAELLPTPVPTAGDRAVAKERFDLLLTNAGEGTLAMLNALLERLSDSTAIGR